MKSFAHHSTHFHIEKSETSVSVDGFALGEPTGMITCLCCLESHLNVDEIGHEPNCPQRFVHSRWYAESMTAE